MHKYYNRGEEIVGKKSVWAIVKARKLVNYSCFGNLSENYVFFIGFSIYFEGNAGPCCKPNYNIL